MWKQDGPDMLYCDGYRIWRIRIVDDPLPFQIDLVRILDASQGPVPIVWPLEHTARRE